MPAAARLLGAVAVLALALSAAVGPRAAPASATHPCRGPVDGRYWDDAFGNHDGCEGGYATVTLRAADDGRTVDVAVGDRVYVDLPAPDPQQRWSGIEAALDGPLLRTHLRAQSDRAVALFRVKRATAGATVTASTDAACFHGEPACAAPERTWSVTVRTTGAAGDSAPDGRLCRGEPRTSDPGTTVLVDPPSGGTVELAVGTRLQVHLTACVAGGGFTPPAGGGPLFRERAVAQQPGSGSARFLAVRPGRTTLTSVLDAPCRHDGGACIEPYPGPGTPWELTVVVPDSTPSPPPPVLVVPSAPPVSGTTIPVDVHSTGGDVDLLRVDADGTERVLRSSHLVDGYRRFFVAPDRSMTLVARHRDRTATANGGASSPVRVQVRAAVSISATRHAARDYVFSGVVRAPRSGRVVRLFRVDPATGHEVLAASGAVRADGTYALRKRFLGSGSFGFVVRTADDETNLAGRSRTRATVVH